MEHPITPPTELVRQWTEEHQAIVDGSMYVDDYIATQAARWGDEKRLEACCKAFENIWGQVDVMTLTDLLRAIRAARRPKPPSLAEQGLKELDLVPTHDQDGRSIDADTSVIRRALERLQQLEQQENND